MTRIGVITQARTTSTRLPGKVLIRAAGDTMLGHHLRRLTDAGLPVHVATTVNAADDPILAAAEQAGVAVHRGSEHDVLDRFAGCVEEHQLETVVRVTSDCPLIDGRLIVRAVEEFEQAQDPGLFLSNTLQRTWPRGFDFEVFSGEALLRAAELATEPTDREHVTPYLYRRSGDHIRLRQVTRAVTGAERYRVTLDTAEDLSLITALMEQHSAHRLDAEQVVAVLDAHPELAAINADTEQKSH